MKIGIAINEVLRDFTNQFRYVCEKYNKSASDSSIINKIDFMYNELKSKGHDDLSEFEEMCLALKEMNTKLKTFEKDGQSEEPDDEYKELYKKIEELYYKYLGDVDLISDYEGIYKDFGFKSKDEMNQFLYFDHPLEVFGHSDLTSDFVMLKFNEFLANLDTDDHELILISREANNSIPATFFFLSKTLCKANNIQFVTKYEDKWKYVDVLITANPRVLKSKPEGKISVKVECEYNNGVEADYTIKKLTDFLESEELQNKILGN